MISLLSSCFLVSPQISSTRNFSTVDSSLVLLSRYIDLVYKDLNENHQFSISPLILEGIKQKRVSDFDLLCPLQVKFIEKGDLSVF